jgi:hypothetical protein
MLANKMWERHCNFSGRRERERKRVREERERAPFSPFSHFHTHSHYVQRDGTTIKCTKSVHVHTGGRHRVDWKAFLSLSLSSKPTKRKTLTLKSWDYGRH